jgi:DNA polymerase III subunit delta
MKASQDQITRALDAPKPDVRLYLLYGPDESGSAALTKHLERAMGSDAERIDLDNPTLKADPARLSDEAAAFSMFGGKRWIRIQPAGEEAVPAIEALLEGAATENPVVAIAGALKPSSALLKLALAHPQALAFASYAPDAGQSARIAETLAREAGLRLDRDTARAIVSASGGDRSMMAQEIEKLSLFVDAAPDRPVEVTAEVYSKIDADSSEGGLGALVDMVLDGRSAQAALELSRLAQDGIEGIPAIRVLAKRILLLAAMRSEVDAGQSPSAVMASTGKAIFWKEKQGVERQLMKWESGRLAIAAQRLLNAERAIKSSASVGPILADVEMIAISRVAARSRA